jgi:hypothetical protein
VSRAFPDLVQLFDELPLPVSDAGLGTFSAQPVPGFPVCAVGKDTSGHPVLLIQAQNAQAGAAAPLALEHLSVIHLVSCRVQQATSGEQERTLSIIRCTENDRAFHEFFLRSLHPVIASLPHCPSRQQISEAIERLVDLFRKIAEAPRKTVTGLWAELLVIARARDPSALLANWHSAAEERFDFVSGSSRVEVKSASGGLRIHHFSLEQVRPAAGTEVMIASVLIERAEGGSSVADMVDVIRSRIIDPNLLIRLDSVVVQTIGQDWRSMQQVRFDLQLANDSLRFLDAASIPAVSLPLPPEVSNIHFRVDLTSHSLSFPEHMINSSQLFRAVHADQPLAP